MKQRTPDDVRVLIRAMGALGQAVHEEQNILAGVMAGAVIDEARGHELEPDLAGNALTARLARIEAAVGTVEAAAVYLMGERRRPGEDGLEYVERLSHICASGFAAAIRARGFQPLFEDIL